MMRALLTSTLALGLLAFGCSKSTMDDINVDRTGGSSGASQGGKAGSSSGTGGSGGQSGQGGQAGSGQGGSASGGAGSSGGATGGSGSGAGGSSAGGTGGSGSGGSGGGGTAGSGAGGSTTMDAPVAADVPAGGDVGGNGPGPGVVPLPGKPNVYICPLTSTKEQCCEMLCECVNRICTDAPKAKAGLANCLPTCMKLSETLVRCHAYHCYESVSPSGMKDHDSHCGHAANQVNGGGCPTGVLP